MRDCSGLYIFILAARLPRYDVLKWLSVKLRSIMFSFESWGLMLNLLISEEDLELITTEQVRQTARSSVNYTIQEYVNDSVSTFVDAGNKNNIPHPNVITESGRSLTAHHSVLIIEVLETTTLPSWDDEEKINENDHELVKGAFSSLG